VTNAYGTVGGGYVPPGYRATPRWSGGGHDNTSGHVGAGNGASCEGSTVSGAWATRERIGIDGHGGYTNAGQRQSSIFRGRRPRTAGASVASIAVTNEGGVGGGVGVRATVQRVYGDRVQRAGYDSHADGTFVKSSSRVRGHGLPRARSQIWGGGHV